MSFSFLPQKKKRRTKESGETKVLGAATPLPAFRAVHPVGVSGEGGGVHRMLRGSCSRGALVSLSLSFAFRLSEFYFQYINLSSFPLLLPSSSSSSCCYELPLLLSLSACSLSNENIGDEGCTKVCNALAEAQNTSVTYLEYVQLSLK